MRINKKLQHSLLTAALTAVPAVVLAADAPSNSRAVTSQSELQPAGSATALRRVPRPAQTVSPKNAVVRQVLYVEDSAQPTSSVGAELQQIFRENGQAVPSVRAQQLPNTTSPNIQLVQHAQNNQPPQQRRSEVSGRREKRQRNGLLRRLFGNLSAGDGAEGDANPYRDSGQPVQQLPPPPPIDFNMKKPSPNSPVPAKPVGFNQNQLRQIPSGSGESQAAGRAAALPLIPGVQQPRPLQRHDGFIDPFDGKESAAEEDTLLDLDSLIEGEAVRNTNTGSQNQQKATDLQSDEELPELPVETAIVPQQPPEAPPAGPYTGYRLETDEQVFAEPKTETASPEIRPQPASEATPEAAPLQTETATPVLDLTPEQTHPQADEESSADPAVPSPSAEAEAETQAEELVLEQIPELDESGDSVPSAGEPSLEEVPLLNQSADQEDAESESWAPTTKETPSAPGADRLRALDSRARQEQQRYRIMARAGKTGFKGFCPVTLRDHRELIDSRPEYKAKFGLQTYYFSSPEAKSAFEADPSRYAPAGGGSDVVLLVNTGEEAAGSLDFSLWYRDRLYMFRSRETQAIFSKDPARYASQY